MANNQILLIDDDQDLCALLSDYLGLEGFDTEIAGDGETGLTLARTGKTYDLILLDVMLPKLDGFAVLQQLRQSHTTPVILLTAKDEDFERIYGLELGADDYLAKPFNTRELLARIKALLRRVGYMHNSALMPQIQVGQLLLDNKTHKAFFQEQLLALTGTEFSILQLLIVNKGKLTSKNDISEHVFGRKLMPYDRSIDMHVSNVRKKLSAFSQAEIIRTIRGGGYMLVDTCG